ncbi:hypothetical protein DXG01_008779, partial [Tephrocybe rancida]
MLDELTFFSSKEWGPEWERCIAALIEFERLRGFSKEGSRLALEERPDFYKAWMKAGRKCNDQRIDGNFAGDWWGWWGTLKRGKNDDDLSIETDLVIDWNSLNKHGSCGCEEHLRRYDGVGGWLAALREVTRVLNKMVEIGQQSMQDTSAVK